MDNKLLETIRDSLKDVHIDSGRRDEFDRVCLAIERAVSEKITAHEIDFYTESSKP